MVAWVSAVVAIVLALAAPVFAQGVATPAVSGPIPSAIPGDPSRNYPWFATTADLAGHGFVEEEFFFEGLARYLVTPGPLAAGVPYRSRMIVRRPASPAAFNGTVVVEWLNVTNSYDLDSIWLRSSAHMLRAGYAYVGVSAQRAGVHGTPNGLRAWSPARYGSLNIEADGLSFDIFSQAMQAIRHPGTVAPLGPLAPARVIATGSSQSAIFLSPYYDAVQPVHGLADAFLFYVGGSAIQADLVGVPALRLLSETDVSEAGRQPDSATFRGWEVAGTSHSDWQAFLARRPLVVRDLGQEPAVDPGCDFPARSRVPIHYVVNAVLDHIARWITHGIVPPAATPLEYVGGEIARDPYGNALGGIRLSGHEVATAVNSGENTGPGFCNLYGRHSPFDDVTLRTLYPTHHEYVSRVRTVTEQTVQDGFVVPADAEETITAARRAKIPPR